MGFQIRTEYTVPLRLTGLCWSFRGVGDDQPALKILKKYTAERMKKYAAEVEETKTPNQQSSAGQG